MLSIWCSKVIKYFLSYIISFESTDQNDPDPNDHDQNDRDRNVHDPNDRDRNVLGPNDRDQNDLDPVQARLVLSEPILREGNSVLNLILRVVFPCSKNCISTKGIFVAGLITIIGWARTEHFFDYRRKWRSPKRRWFILTRRHVSCSVFFLSLWSM